MKKRDKKIDTGRGPWGVGVTKFAFIHDWPAEKLQGTRKRCTFDPA